MMSFAEWVDDRFKGNVADAARYLDEGFETVRAWYKGRNNPRPATMRKIERLSDGVVTLVSWFPAPSPPAAPTPAPQPAEPAEASQ